jgi:hypothetical protein
MQDRIRNDPADISTCIDITVIVEVAGERTRGS